MLFGSAGARSTPAGVACARSTEALMSSNEARIMTAPRLGPVALVAHDSARRVTETSNLADLRSNQAAEKQRGTKGGRSSSCCGKPFQSRVLFLRDGPSAPPPSAQPSGRCHRASIQPPAKLHSEVKRFGTHYHGSCDQWYTYTLSVAL